MKMSCSNLLLLLLDEERGAARFLDSFPEGLLLRSNSKFQYFRLSLIGLHELPASDFSGLLFRNLGQKFWP